MIWFFKWQPSGTSCGCAEEEDSSDTFPVNQLKVPLKTYKAIKLRTRGADDDDGDGDDEQNIEPFDLLPNYFSIVHFGDCGGPLTKGGEQKDTSR